MHAGKQVGGVDKGWPGGAPCCCGYISRAADAQSADADATFWQLEEDNKKLKGHVKQLTDENEVIRAELQQNKSNIEERSGKERAPTDKDREPHRLREELDRLSQEYQALVCEKGACVLPSEAQLCTLSAQLRQRDAAFRLTQQEERALKQSLQDIGIIQDDKRTLHKRRSLRRPSRPRQAMMRRCMHFGPRSCSCSASAISPRRSFCTHMLLLPLPRRRLPRSLRASRACRRRIRNCWRWASASSMSEQSSRTP